MEELIKEWGRSEGKQSGLNRRRWLRERDGLTFSAGITRVDCNYVPVHRDMYPIIWSMQVYWHANTWSFGTELYSTAGKYSTCTDAGFSSPHLIPQSASSLRAIHRTLYQVAAVPNTWR